ncbi:hypothetical protein TIFTF001_008825 [Ficus carica]|uniref:J domain-containing protein n=1 Tax=Ficus carica TaxID=3494 RepID=A0AA87ZVK6_FICCA|nr:hypothetical protein TIFTF001_008825 [Ficus carica]
MSRQQRLWTPLSSAVLRRVALSSSPSSSTINLAAISQSPFRLSPHSDNSRLFVSHIRGLDFLRNFPFSGKHFLCSQSALSLDAKCWNCNAAAEAALFLVCPSCRCIQPVDQSVDYFQIFGLEKKYNVEDDNLQGKYKEWQMKLHPDLVHSKSEKEREYAAEQSARVIDAYHTLSKPLSRAIYIMKLEGVNINEEETISDLEFLSEILEIREAVEEASDSQALNQIRSEMEEKLKHWSNFFANASQNRNFEDAVKAIRRMTYYERVIEEIVKKL